MLPLVAPTLIRATFRRGAASRIHPLPPPSHRLVAVSNLDTAPPPPILSSPPLDGRRLMPRRRLHLPFASRSPRLVVVLPLAATPPYIHQLALPRAAVVVASPLNATAKAQVNAAEGAGS